MGKGEKGWWEVMMNRERREENFGDNEKFFFLTLS